MIILLVSALLINVILTFLVLLVALKIQKINNLSKKHNTGQSPKLSKNFEKKLEAEVEKLIEGSKKRLDAKLSLYFQTLVDDAVRKGTDLSDFIEKQQEAIVKETQFLAARDVTRLQQDLEKYRADKFAQIDQKVNQMVADVAKQVLGKVIDVSTHEHLVKAALERAKKEGFIGHG